MIVVDVETGGIDPIKNPLLSIGAVNFDYPKEQFYGECAKPCDLECTQEALDINGIDLAEWETKPLLGETMHEFSLWLADNNHDNILAGHNPRFDLDFLKINFERCGATCPFGYRTVDLHSIAFYLFFTDPTIDHTKLKSDAIYKAVKMETEPKPHNALVGAKYETEALYRLIFGHGCGIV